MFMSVETDIREKIDVVQLVDVFSSKAHRQMELYLQQSFCAFSFLSLVS